MRDQRRGDDVVSQVQLVSGVRDGQEVHEILRIEVARVRRNQGRKVREPYDRDSVLENDLVWLAEGAVCRQFAAAMSTITEPARIPRTASSVTSTGDFLPGTFAVDTMTSNFFSFSVSAACCLRFRVFRELLGVTARAGAFFANLDLDVFRA